jgi:hypothetical protein
MRSLIFIWCMLTSISLCHAQTMDWYDTKGGAKKGTYPTEDAIKDVAIDRMGNVYTVGYFTGSIVLPNQKMLTNTLGSYDIVIAKYDSKGILLWIKKFGASQVDKAIDIEITELGDIYVLGTFSGQNYFSYSEPINLLKSKEGTDMFIAKFDGNGKVLWSKGIGTEGNDEAIAMVYTSKKELWVTGYVTSLSDLNAYNAVTNNKDSSQAISLGKAKGKLNTLVVKLNLTGEVIDHKLWGSEATSVLPTALHIDQTNHVYLAGTFGNEFNIDPFGKKVLEEVSPKGSGDAFIAKFTSDFKLEWSGTLSGVQTEYINSIGTDTLGGVYLAGAFSANTNFDFIAGKKMNYTAKGVQDLFIAKYESKNGSFVKLLTLGDSGRGVAHALDVKNDGTLYVSGALAGSGNVYAKKDGTEGTIGSAGKMDIWFAKLNADLKAYWMYNIGGGENDLAYIIKSKNKKIYLAGYFTGDITTQLGKSKIRLYVDQGAAEDSFILVLKE